MNKTFLECVASWLKRKYNNDLSQIAIVLPNKRASLFLSQALLKEMGGTFWSPVYCDMPGLFSSLSQESVNIADDIELIFRLYRTFEETTHFQIDGEEETLDHFFGWGQVLLSDFDDLDKNMANADSVFRNVSELHDFDSSEFLDETQKATLQKYFANFNAEGDTLRENFLTVWNRLHEVYAKYNEELRQVGITYEGALFRQVAEEIKSKTDTNDAEWIENKFPLKKYIFIGFNMMQKVEQTLVSCLQKMGKADVIWNYDDYYVKAKEQEAGVFLRNTRLSSIDTTDLDEKGCVYTGMTRIRKNVIYLKSSTDDAQVRYVRQWLEENNGARLKAGNRTAIVLCDETLLPNVLHALPKGDYDLNVTMGYPLKQTELASFVFALLDLCLHGIINKDGKITLRPPQLRDLTSQRYFHSLAKEDFETYQENSTLFFSDLLGESTDLDLDQTNNPEVANRLIQNVLSRLGKTSTDSFFQESVFRMWTVLNRLKDLMTEGIVTLTPIIYERLVGQLISSLSVPFHGEPAIGIQIMGLLETRCLDFDHVLMLSCNEGFMPKAVNDTSFLPYIVRKANDLTTIDNKVAVFAYYFYSLLQRASDISISYCDNNDSSGQAKERSRFLLQLLVEKTDNIHIVQKELVTESTSIKQECVTSIPKTESDIDVIRQRETGISPSSLITYMQCGLKYYYQYVLKIREPEELNPEDVLEANTFGSIFHQTAQFFYEKAKGNNVTASFFDDWIDDNGKWKKNAKLRMSLLVDQAMVNVYENDLKRKSVSTKWEGLDLIVRQSVISFMHRLLIMDRQRTPFAIRDLEGRVEGSIGGMKMGGIIDRLEVNGDNLYVIDYKTGKWDSSKNAICIGKNKNNINDIEDLRNGKLRNLIEDDATLVKANYYFQTLLYCCLLRQSKSWQGNIVPRLLFPLGMSDLKVETNDLFNIFGGGTEEDANEWYDAFEGFIDDLISEITDVSQPFRTHYEEECQNKYCKFQDLCGRKKKDAL